MPKHLYTIPYGTSLPSPAGLPEGYPFRLDPDNILYTIKDGAFVALTGGGGGGGTTGFTDNFDRSDRVLDGDNGWAQSDPPNTADLSIVGGVVKVPVGAATTSGWAPIVHNRNDGDPNVADVTVTITRTDTTGFTYFVPLSDADFQTGLHVDTDGSSTPLGISPHMGGSDYGDLVADGTGVTVHPGVYAAWTPSGTITLRATYNNTTRAFNVYVNSVLAIEVADIQATIDHMQGGTDPSWTFPDISLVPKAGFASNAGVGIETFDDFICV